MKARPGFWIALFLLFLLFPMVQREVYAQSTSTVSISGSGSFQILASGGANPSNSYNINYLVLAAATTTGVTAQLVTGTQNGNACNSATALTGSIPITDNTVPPIIAQGNPAIVVPGSSALCIITTGGTVGGWMTINR